jgi:hypothetical protein
VRGGEQCAAERGEHMVNVYCSTGHELAFYREQGERRGRPGSSMDITRISYQRIMREEETEALMILNVANNRTDAPTDRQGARMARGTQGSVGSGWMARTSSWRLHARASDEAGLAAAAGEERRARAAR